MPMATAKTAARKAKNLIVVIFPRRRRYASQNSRTWNTRNTTNEGICSNDFKGIQFTTGTKVAPAVPKTYQSVYARYRPELYLPRATKTEAWRPIKLLTKM
mmetsp:Transcript_6003/g.14817  ORF Transcript_6003/g.14817 Transcript_6003/m.14817 type:complete len:101 (+) Transcript_6003:1467-1769(+)